MNQIQVPAAYKKFIIVFERRKPVSLRTDLVYNDDICSISVASGFGGLIISARHIRAIRPMYLIDRIR